MVKQFVILPSDHDWITICRAMEAKGMPVEVQDGEMVIYAWNQGVTFEGGITVMEFAEQGDQPGPGWVRPDERDPKARRAQREAELQAALDDIEHIARSQ